MIRWLALVIMIFSVMAHAADDSRDAAEADSVKAKEGQSKWNEYDGKYFTAALGGGLLVDTARYYQDEESKKQMKLNAAIDLRDFRFLLKGRFKFAPRLSYSIGYMYDAPIQLWRFRQTGLMLDVPELNGNIFVGRTKEGFSTNKLMVGYHGWTNERSAANDAFLPILADGIKWTGNGFKKRLVYNVGAFIGSLTDQPYVKNDYQFAGRAVWLPLAEASKDNVLHLALESRWGKSKKDNLQYRSKPESFPAQSYAVDTSKFPAESSLMFGFETYYRSGPLLLGTEYFTNQVQAAKRNDPFFHGGEIVVDYLINGVRPYNGRGAYFEAVSPTRSLFSGGGGAWELVFRTSYVDLNSGPIQGGRFLRFTPMVNWHLSDNVRLEVVYGYSVLDRLSAFGETHYLQTRLQLTLM